MKTQVQEIVWWQPWSFHDHIAGIHVNKCTLHYDNVMFSAFFVIYEYESRIRLLLHYIVKLCNHCTLLSSVRSFTWAYGMPQPSGRRLILIMLCRWWVEPIQKFIEGMDEDEFLALCKTTYKCASKLPHGIEDPTTLDTNNVVFMSNNGSNGTLMWWEGESLLFTERNSQGGIVASTFGSLALHLVFKEHNWGGSERLTPLEALASVLSSRPSYLGPLTSMDGNHVGI